VTVRKFPGYSTRLPYRVVMIKIGTQNVEHNQQAKKLLVRFAMDIPSH